MNESFLNLPITSLRMIGESYAQKLSRLEIHTVGDLLHHYPFRYDDLTLSPPIESITDGQLLTLNGSIVSISNIKTRNGKQMQKAIFASVNDDIYDVVWFNQPYLIQTFKQTPTITLSGKVKIFRNKPSFTAPSYEVIKSNEPHANQSIHTNRLVPTYHLTSGLSSKYLRSRISPLLKNSLQFPDWLPKEIIEAENLYTLKQALENIHFPQSYADLDLARFRLKFDELFLLQLKSQLHRQSWTQNHSAHPLSISSQLLDQFLKQLPFQLTSAQARCLHEIATDLNQPIPMNRLLQGDVGSGKTVLAAVGAYIAHLNHQVAIIMAPTEVLAHQHASTIAQLLKPYNLNVSVQTRSSKNLQTQPDLIIGTHAILHRPIPQNVGLVVIDEQHRFGVEQRTKLLKQKTHTPHLLSMTATPIPRTIALTLYSDLNLSVINEMPPGRKPVTTWVIPAKKRQSAYDWIAQQITTYQTQVFVVCPLIEDSETPTLDQVKAAQTEFTHLSTHVFTQFRIGLVHGNMSSKVKQQVINDFSDRKLDILVATPVIEVGIDIPNASIMIIEGAERFGLAALHQLRGRVGRGSLQSYCLLFSTTDKPNPRLKHMEKIHSGLELAQLDLDNRGAGNIYGVQQSGHLNLKIASFSDHELISLTHKYATNIAKTDPELTNYPKLKSILNSHLEKDSSPN